MQFVCIFFNICRKFEFLIFQGTVATPIAPPSCLWAWSIAYFIQDVDGVRTIKRSWLFVKCLSYCVTGAPSLRDVITECLTAAWTPAAAYVTPTDDVSSLKERHRTQPWWLQRCWGQWSFASSTSTSSLVRTWHFHIAAYSQE